MTNHEWWRHSTHSTSMVPAWERFVTVPCRTKLKWKYKCNRSLLFLETFRLMVEKWPKTPKQFHWLSTLLMGSRVSDLKSYKNALYCMTSEPLQLITRDATIPFFQIRSDPIQKILSIGRFRSDPILAQFFFFFINQCRVSILLCHLLCVKHKLIDNLI